MSGLGSALDSVSGGTLSKLCAGTPDSSRTARAQPHELRSVHKITIIVSSSDSRFPQTINVNSVPNQKNIQFLKSFLDFGKASSAVLTNSFVDFCVFIKLTFIGARFFSPHVKD